MLAEFRSLVCLTEDEDHVLDGWAYDKSTVWIAMRWNLSTRTVGYILARLRALYDEVQPYSPLLPPRDVPGKPTSPSHDGRGCFYRLNCRNLAEILHFSRPNISYDIDR